MNEQANVSKPRSTKPALIGAIAIVGAFALLASVQTWLKIEFVVGAATVESLTIAGQKVNPALSLIALAALAAALVLMIAGKVFRRVIGALVFLLGVGLAVLAFATISSPLSRADGQISSATGIAGDAQAALVSSVDLSVWPMLTVAAGVLLAAIGILITVMSGRWKSAGRKYDTAPDDAKRKQQRETEATGDRISDWDALSDGDDPTDE